MKKSFLSQSLRRKLLGLVIFLIVCPSPLAKDGQLAAQKAMFYFEQLDIKTTGPGVELSEQSLTLPNKRGALSIWIAHLGLNTLILSEDGYLRSFEGDKGKDSQSSGSTLAEDELLRHAEGIRNRLFPGLSFRPPTKIIRGASASKDLDMSASFRWSVYFGDYESELSIAIQLERASARVKWISSDVDMKPGPKDIALSAPEARAKAISFVEQAVENSELSRSQSETLNAELAACEPKLLFCKAGGSWGIPTTQKYADRKEVRLGYRFEMNSGYVAIDAGTGELLGAMFATPRGPSQASSPAAIPPSGRHKIQTKQTSEVLWPVVAIGILLATMIIAFWRRNHA